MEGCRLPQLKASRWKARLGSHLFAQILIDVSYIIKRGIQELMGGNALKN